jgi:hypothetical protein
MTLMERIWSRVKRGAADECWLWTGATNDKGYGFAWMDGRSVRVHRVVFEQENGPIPLGFEPLHSCDNPPCCNPGHLVLGTHAQNVADMATKLRSTHGERNPSSRFKESDIRMIRSGGDARDLARIYGTTPTYIRQIQRKIVWKHVT